MVIGKKSHIPINDIIEEDLNDDKFQPTPPLKNINMSLSVQDTCIAPFDKDVSNLGEGKNN